MSPHETAGAEVTTALAIVKTLILILGTIITYYAFKAYRRTQSTALGALALGFGAITLGSFLAGVATDILGVPLAAGILIESLLVLVGFAIIAYSLYAR
ncbi:DUF7521 family protein [Natranaeroarchaeum aerophilus]|uniref:YapH protein n=1 Tax=Natranaeroarchaeum aerophilus TaxID=2917711 RepID=A0AAE3K7D6_9EURY|nr:hypothetical protein [Natranaeroarchaeum aerophilus]MCL9813794.1 hypothetical protein [Natranaeroarchaeum aerophilus]